jgi:hypothetical protein
MGGVENTDLNGFSSGTIWPESGAAPCPAMAA